MKSIYYEILDVGDHFALTEITEATFKRGKFILRLTYWPDVHEYEGTKKTIELVVSGQLIEPNFDESTLIGYELRDVLVNNDRSEAWIDVTLRRYKFRAEANQVEPMIVFRSFLRP